ncbi:TRAP transporter substrate-binding protein [Marinobacterium lutimaris]|uniref:TRAP-type C4-dicarboxylate transport system, substrate-binding protein n=1 Tax=Marinobacterium lutimaris TaxID=568106 RepID=A0A1H6C9S7_9GAMM|nr:TRAP transporter substrate-binding protein [Marinobacterium lutimaris]SEG69662.1 TRAP-type C4-dicarboxylate transport system, substrate-binding protein [Marinobacterium lutimaris]
MKKIISTSLLTAAVVLGAQTASASTTLRFSHMFPSASAYQTELFEAWAKSVEEDSNGELNINIYPSQTLVKAATAYEGTINGISDITVVIQGYNAGRFILSEITQLPGITSSAQQGSCILQTLYDEDKISGEYEDTKTLFLFSTGPAYLHTRDREIKEPADLAGLRMRRPNEVAGTLLTQMGATPVATPAPEIYQGLERGVFDGLSFPFEGMKGFRINELTNYHLQIPYTSSIFVVSMNQSSYDKLSPQQKAAIDKNSGMKWAMKAGDVFAELDKEGLEEAQNLGHVVQSIENPLEDAKWSQPLKQGTETYLERAEQRGKPQAREVYERALALRSECASV